MDKLLSFIIFVTILSYCEPWFFDGVLDHGNVDRCPQSIPRDNFLFAYNDTCIQLIRDEHTWNDARRYCTQHHGDLVMIQDKVKQQFIMKALKKADWDKNGVWIGGTDSVKEGHWKWINGQSMAWGNWESGQGPGNRGFLFSNGKLEDCAVIRKDDGYKWHDYPCNIHLPQFRFSSICEYKFIPALTSTMMISKSPAQTTKQMKITKPTTQTSTTLISTTQTSTAPAPTTETSTTLAPTTQTSTTPVTTTQISITPSPTTQTSVTLAPTTQTSTTPEPTTQTSTTNSPTIQTSTTFAPTTQTSTTPAPTTQTSTTPAPTTQTSTTRAPTTQKSITPARTTQTSTIPTPTTQKLITPAPTTQTSIRPVPSTQTSTTRTPTTQTSIKHVPSTQIPTTRASTTQTSITPATTTQKSITPAPTTQTTKPSAQTTNPVTTTQEMKKTKFRSTIPLTTQLVNNQGGLLRRSDTGQKPKNKSSTGYIIGGVCVAVVVAGIIVAVFIIKRRRLSSNDANRKVHGAENPMYSVMYDDTSVPPVGADIQINDMYEPTKYFTNGESIS